MKKNYIAPQEEIVVLLSYTICAASEAEYDGVLTEGVTIGEELSFD